MRSRWLLAVQGLTALLLLWSAVAMAHDARPVAVTIVETLPGVYRGQVATPDTVAVSNVPSLVWPSQCEPVDGTAEPQLMSCPEGLTGTTLQVNFPLFNPSLAVYYQVQTLDGLALTAMQAPSDIAWQVPEAMAPSQVALQYLLFGIEHIIGGLDHLLFVLGLLVIARTPRRILWTVTGFTLAHSITLSLSALGMIHIPIAPVEATIALSIVFLAHEISRHRDDSLAYRYPMGVSFGFGLLHGLGFASALGETGLVPTDVAVSLLFFNLGVEVGQVLFIIAVLALVALLRRLRPSRSQGGGAGRMPRMELAAAYVIGVPSAYWLIDRLAGFF